MWKLKSDGLSWVIRSVWFLYNVRLQLCPHLDLLTRSGMRKSFYVYSSLCRFLDTLGCFSGVQCGSVYLTEEEDSRWAGLQGIGGLTHGVLLVLKFFLSWATRLPFVRPLSWSFISPLERKRRRKIVRLDMETKPSELLCCLLAAYTVSMLLS